MKKVYEIWKIHPAGGEAKLVEEQPNLWRTFWRLFLLNMKPPQRPTKYYVERREVYANKNNSIRL